MCGPHCIKAKQSSWSVSFVPVLPVLPLSRGVTSDKKCYAIKWRE